MLDINYLKNNLYDFGFIKDIIYFNEIDSTNKYCKDFNLNDGTLVIAGFQKTGRGRLNHFWESDKDENVLISIVKEFDISGELIQYVNFYFSLITLFVLHKFTENPEIKLKWPNDIIYQDKKLAGILSEGMDISSPIKKFVIGIGINVNQKSFTTTIDKGATSLFNICNKKFDIQNIILELCLMLGSFYQIIYNPERLMTIWKKYSIGIGKKVSYINIDQNEIKKGIIDEIDNSGAIIIKDSSGKKVKHYSGEISFI